MKVERGKREQKSIKPVTGTSELPQEEGLIAKKADTMHTMIWNLTSVASINKLCLCLITVRTPHYRSHRQEGGTRGNGPAVCTNWLISLCTHMNYNILTVTVSVRLGLNGEQREKPCDGPPLSFFATRFPVKIRK